MTTRFKTGSIFEAAQLVLQEGIEVSHKVSGYQPGTHRVETVKSKFHSDDAAAKHLHDVTKQKKLKPAHKAMAAHVLKLHAAGKLSDTGRYHLHNTASLHKD